MRRRPHQPAAFTFVVAGMLLLAATGLAVQAQSPGYADLLKLFEEWRAFEEPPRVEGGVPDYSPATNARRLEALRQLQARLQAIGTPAGRSRSKSTITWCAPR